jgi:hypothetical protein
MKISVTLARVHGIVFGVLFACQLFTVWLLTVRFGPVQIIWWTVPLWGAALMWVAIQALVTTIVVVELFEGIRQRGRSYFHWER